MELFFRDAALGEGIYNTMLEFAARKGWELKVNGGVTDGTVTVYHTDNTKMFDSAEISHSECGDLDRISIIFTPEYNNVNELVAECEAAMCDGCDFETYDSEVVIDIDGDYIGVPEYCFDVESHPGIRMLVQLLDRVM